MKTESMKTEESQSRSMLPDWRQTVGLEQNMQELSQLLSSAFLHPVVLLQGAEGFGKRHLALWMAAKQFCVSGTACGTCGECREILAGIHPDVLVVQDLEETSIKSAVLEQLQTNLSILSPRGLRIAIIPNCDRMTPEAANRMLKTLEEPPEQIRFILTTSRPKALLPTVLGRCLRWRVLPPDQKKLLSWLKALLNTQEGAALDDLMLLSWIRRAGSSPGVLKRQVEDTSDKVASVTDRVQSLLNARQPSEVVRIAEELARTYRLTVPEYLAAQEWILNDLYRAGKTAGRLGLVAARRDVSRDLRRLAGFGKIHLNTQLAAESVGLLPFGISSEDSTWRI